MSGPDPDLLAATRPLVAAFERLGVAYFLGGSVASSAYGLPRTTLDGAYLHRWAAALGVPDLLLRALDGASLTRPGA